MFRFVFRIAANVGIAFATQCAIGDFFVNTIPNDSNAANRERTEHSINKALGT